MMKMKDAEVAVHEDRDWVAYTKGLLRAEMVKRGISYAGLVEKLAAIGVKDSEANLRNKISRGGFTGAFLIQCLVAMGATTLRLDD
ncbi:MAG: hypothetical protein JNK30_22925 [Phenylobacterium sp.]|uniref:DUF6471 domain-containing protein n=1 Tax=Phenylobacterium sp. TaxID=1871053 RepID=UPI001A3CE225|nr:DUF6471 domain-containing protein [Phenylobacterium sp.]MBL8774261.1 hypothetical protein [Phenylobacterium sp.]